MALIPGQQLRPVADNGELQVGAAGAAGVVLGGLEQEFLYSLGLPRGPHRQQAQIQARRLHLQVGAADEGAVGGGAGGEQGSAGRGEQPAQPGGVEAGAGEQVGFGGPALAGSRAAVGLVDEGFQRGKVGGGGGGEREGHAAKVRRAPQVGQPLKPA